MAKRKTAREKLHREQELRVVEQRGKLMVIPRPLDVDAAIRRVRKGRLTTVSAIRDRLARDNGADTACPFCTGIFIRMSAEAAEEERAEGRKRITPWWRVVRDNGSLHDKLPGHFDKQTRRLRTEGHEVAADRKTPRVPGFGKKLQRS